MLLAVYVPMLVFSSLHIHETTETADTECTDCVHHNCHGHLTATATWAHDCVLCQFLTLTMVAATATAAVFLLNRGAHVFAPFHCRIATTACGVVSLRGPPFA